MWNVQNITCLVCPEQYHANQISIRAHYLVQHCSLTALQNNIIIGIEYSTAGVVQMTFFWVLTVCRIMGWYWGLGGTGASIFKVTVICSVIREREMGHSLAGDILSSRHMSSWCYACSWDVKRRSNIEFYGADSHFCHSAYIMWSRMGIWSAHVPARLSNFCCRTHFVRRDVCVECSSDITSCFQKWRKCVLKKCANGPFYMTPSHQIIEISIWEPTHGDREGVENKM